MYLLAKQISKINDFEILFFNGDYNQAKIEFFDKIKSIKTFSLPQKESFFSKIFKAIKLFNLLKKHKPDVTISTTANSTLYIIYLYTKIFNKKNIFRSAHLFDIDNTWVKNNGLVGKLYKFALKKSHQIVTQSAEHKAIISSNFNKQSIILKNVFEIKKFDTVSKKGILWVGRFQKWKNPDMFLELSSLFPETQFTMICPYEKGDFLEWEKLRKKTEIINNLTFIKKVPFHEIQVYFNKSEIFVNTSTAEGFPNTFLQAAVGKTPIVSINVNPDNFIKNYNCGFYCNNNFELMKKNIETLINNKNNKLGENCFNYLKENHDIEKTGNQLEQIIKLLVVRG